MVLQGQFRLLQLNISSTVLYFVKVMLHMRLLTDQNTLTDIRGVPSNLHK